MRIIIPIYVCFSFILLLLLLLLLPQSSNVKALNNEAQALLSIKNAVGSSASNITLWDTSASNPCNWTGVTCSSFNRVISLNMSRFGLRGTLPSDSFASLTALTSLDLSNNFLTSPLPSMSMLTQLHDLNLTFNAFSEEFPNDILSLKQLVELRIDNNKFQGAVPEGISALSNLQELWLGNNTLTSLPKSLSSLVDLTVLTAWGNVDLKITQLPSQWGAWVNLTYLNLHDIGLRGTLPSAWGANFTKLQRLHLYNNELIGSIPESWKTMTSLKELRIATNDLSGIVPSWIGNLQNTADRVDFKCNFLQGSYPAFFNESTWKGNCFDSDFRAHKQACGDKRSCEEFFAKKKAFPIGAIIGSVIGVGVILCGITALIWWFKPFSTSKNRRRHGNDQDTGNWEVPPGVRRFTYKEIMKATKSFSKDSEIGEGGFGKVYVGHLDDNKQVAIKRASDVSFQGIKEFRNEIMLLSRLHHRHLVRLEGFCDDKDEQILVYEYMKNGNLHRHLFDKDASTLNWYRRIEIALGVAQGLEYLHTFADPPVIHRDVKPSNILLDGNMIAKVSDFGISKANPEMDTHVSTRPAGTAGYLDPEYFLRRQLTTASDVYGYGVVLLELLTGQVAIDHRRTEDYNLVGWVNGKLKWNGNVRAIIDPRLGSNYPIDAYKQVVDIAVQCTIYDRNDRPKMQAVAASLEQILRGLQPPPEHMVILPPPSPTSLPSKKAHDQTTNSLNDIKITYGLEVEPR